LEGAIAMDRFFGPASGDENAQSLAIWVYSTK
jgi:hypothetical protein